MLRGSWLIVLATALATPAAFAQIHPAMGMIVTDGSGAVLGQVVGCQEGQTDNAQRCVVGVDVAGQVYPIAVNARNMVGGSTHNAFPSPYVAGAIYFTEQGCSSEHGPYLAEPPENQGWTDWIWRNLPPYAVVDTTLYVEDPTATPSSRLVRSMRISSDNGCKPIGEVEIIATRAVSFALPGADQSFRLIPSNVIFIDGFPNAPLDEWSDTARQN